MTRPLRPLSDLTPAQVAAMHDALPTTRTCDGCDACCTYLGVGELEKPAGVRCDHLCGDPGRSCSIYEERPPSCQEFICLWRASTAGRALPEHFRPDKIGFAISMSDPREAPLVITVFTDPARPLAWQRPDTLPILKRLAAVWNAIVAIGAGADAVALISPKGNVIRRHEATILFKGGDVGLPATEFLRPPTPLLSPDYWPKDRR